MQEIQAGFFERIGYAIGLLKDNLVQIILPLFLYHFVTKIILGGIGGFVFMQNMDMGAMIKNPQGEFLALWSDPAFIISIVVGMALFLAYALLVIPFSFATIKAIKNAYYKQDNILKDNISYGFKRFMSILQLYWYIFAYVALIPCIIIIVGGLFTIVGMLNQANILNTLGGLISGIGVILLTCFAIYRGVRAFFSLYHAVEQEDFERGAFNASIQLTEGSWWRIVGNVFFFSILLSIILGMVSGIIKLGFAASSLPGIQDLMTDVASNGGQISQEQISNITQEFTSFSFAGLIKSILLLIISSVKTSLTMVFIYVLYQRFMMENTKQPIKNTIMSGDKVEL